MERIYSNPHFPRWEEGVPMRRLLSKRLGLAIANTIWQVSTGARFPIENSANCRYLTKPLSKEIS